MSANVFAFPSRAKGPQPWTNDELAELYRVVDLLGRAGLAVTTDMGMSDEGDPWFVFCRVDNEEVIAHFARIDGSFVAASIAVDETFRGANFRQIVDRMVSSQPLVVPKPGAGGSRLFMHPAVLLTAFVATALAHSEKMLAQDVLRAVEAEWDHGKTAALNEIKHIKTGWLDTLNSLWKLPLQESKLAHDTVKETQALTLASLIAIAMSALQPIVEKISMLSQMIADELPGHGGTAVQNQAAHAAQMAQDGQFADLTAGPVTDHGNGQAQAGDEAPQSHKIAAAPADNGSDSQKSLVDSAHVLPVSAVQKAGATDDTVHTPAASVETSDVNGAYQLLQQKTTMVVAPASAPEPAVFHIDLSSSVVQTVNPQDVTAEALQFLHILKPESGTDAQKSGGEAVALAPIPDVTPTTPTPAPAQPESTPTPTPAQPALTPSPTQLAGTDPTPTVSPTPSPAPSPADVGPQEINTNIAPGEQVIGAITAFANDAAHTISNPSAITFSASLQQELSGYFGSSGSLKIVIFDTTAPIKDVFSFAPGIVFVADKDLDPQSLISNHGGNLTLDVANGQQVILVGVATIDYHAAAV